MPTPNQFLSDVPFSVFEDIRRSIELTNPQKLIGLHQGKTVLRPCAQLGEWGVGDFEMLAHQHASPEGIGSLRKEIASKLSYARGIDYPEESITITCGATHGVSIATRIATNPGDEVLILSPQWLFTVGIVKSVGAIPVEVPIFLEISKNPGFEYTSYIESFITSKTRAIYFNTPNNPTGISWGYNNLRSLASLAEKYNLWIISDNAYDLYDFSDEGFVDISTIEEAKERTFSVYTFSKAYSMPGYRIGYLISPKNAQMLARKFALYSLYSVSTASQYGAYQALQTDQTLISERIAHVRQSRDITARILEIPSTEVDGGFYTLLNLSEWRDGDVSGFIRESIKLGVSVAPGIAFGQSCQEYARLCFTAATHEDLVEGIHILNEVYKSGRI